MTRYERKKQLEDRISIAIHIIIFGVGYTYLIGSVIYELLK